MRIALPKGRMSEETLEYLYSKSITSIDRFPESRKLIFRDEEKDLEFLLIRSKDVGTYVEQGAADLGVIGHDLLQEHSFDVCVLSSLPFGDCHLSVAYPEGQTEWKQQKNIRVATKYPHLTSKYFFNRGFNTEIIELYGSIEIAPLTGISDVIVDLVSTGGTLRANHLTEEEQILYSTARLIVNRSSSVFKRRSILDLIDRMNNN